MPEIETNNSPSPNLSKENIPVPVPTDKKWLFMGKRGAKILAVVLVFILFASVFLIFLQLSGGEKSAKKSNTNTEKSIDSNDLTNQRGEDLNERFLRGMLEKSKISMPQNLQLITIPESDMPSDLKFILEKLQEKKNLDIFQLVGDSNTNVGWRFDFSMRESIKGVQKILQNLLSQNGWGLLQAFRNQWVGLIEMENSQYKLRAVEKNITESDTHLIIDIIQTTSK